LSARYTPQEVEEWAEIRQQVAPQAAGHGIVVYEKARGPITHELRDQMELGLPHYPVLGEFTGTVVDYTEFAVRLRYDDLP
jgi:hypothetical protein